MAPFEDRGDAGRQLAGSLAAYRERRPLILALPRGGVPVAFEVAKMLGAELDVLLARKIGVPGHEELALGAVVDGRPPELVINEDVQGIVRMPEAEIEAAMRHQLGEIARRRVLYRGDRAPPDIEGRTVIVVDDGIATGATVKAALRGVRRMRPGTLVLAVPVAPASTIETLRDECDRVICLATPEPFHAVGMNYQSFEQTSDEEVVELLHGASAFPKVAPDS